MTKLWPIVMGMSRASAAGGGSGQLAQRDGVLHGGREHAPPPPTTCTCRQWRWQLGGPAAHGARKRTSCRTSACESGFQRPPTSTARTKRRWPPPRSNFLCGGNPYCPH